MTEDILFTIWFFLPAALANSSPAVASKLSPIKDLNYPLDFYKKYKGKRLLGDHKTIRGLITGVTVAVFVVIIQRKAFVNYQSVREIVFIDYSENSIIWIGVLLGLGTIVGDAVKSFFKRRKNLRPGAPWIPFDQIDFIIGSSLFSLLYIKLLIKFYFLFLILGIGAHLLTNVIAYILNLKDVPY